MNEMTLTMGEPDLIVFSMNCLGTVGRVRAVSRLEGCRVIKCGGQKISHDLTFIGKAANLVSQNDIFLAIDWFPNDID